MTAPQSTDPVILPWAELEKRAEREGIDIMVYVNSMNAHIQNQRATLARVHENNLKLAAENSQLRGLLHGIATCGQFNACDLCRDLIQPHVRQTS